MKDSGYAAVLVLHCFSVKVSNRHSSRTIILEIDRLFNTNDTGCDMLFLFLIKQSAPSSSCTNVPHINSISCLWKMFVTVQRNICQSYFCLFLMETSVEGWWWYLTPAQKGRVRIPVGAAVFNACNGYRMIDLSMYIFYFHFIFDLFFVRCVSWSWWLFAHERYFAMCSWFWRRLVQACDVRFMMNDLV